MNILSLMLFRGCRDANKEKILKGNMTKLKLLDSFYKRYH